MAAFILSNLTGLVRQILISHAFGTSFEIDAFNAASTFPDLIFNLIAGGALSSAFVPTFTSLLAKDDRRAPWLLASAVANIIVILLTLLSLLSALFAPQIVAHVLAPQFSPEKQALTASLLRVLLVAPAIFGLSGLLMGILNSHQIFLTPAVAPTMYSVGIILGVVAFAPFIGVYGLAWGAVMGAALHLGVQIPSLLRLPDRRYFTTLGLHLTAVREVARLMGPRLLGVAIVQINFVVNTIIASGLPDGSLTAIKVAWTVMYMPQVVIAQAIAIAALPTFSAQVARGEIKEMGASLAATLRGVILLSLPASLGLIALRYSIIATLFQRGAFDAHSTDLVAWALLWYAAGLVGHCVVEIIARAFYALHDTKTPVAIGTAAMSLNVVFSLTFSALFTRVGWAPHGGLAAANSLATALEMVGLLILMRRRLKGLDGAATLRGISKAALAALAMFLAVWVWTVLAAGASAWMIALFGIAIGGVVYVLVVLALRVPEGYALGSVLLGYARRFLVRRPA